MNNPEYKLEQLKNLGGKIINAVEKRSWGDEVGYGIDLDGHLIAFARTHE